MCLKPAFRTLALFSLSFVLVSITAVPAHADARATGAIPAELESLLKTMNERLQIADLVALTKWDSGKPIQDSDRESKVIANAQRQAVGYGVGEEDSQQLLAAQIEANKLVQYGLLAAWHTAGQAPQTQRPDLNNQIRPHLDELQSRLLEQFARFQPFRRNAQCSAWLSQGSQKLANDPLHELAIIRATGELCIRGTPPV